MSPDAYHLGLRHLLGGKDGLPVASQHDKFERYKKPSKSHTILMAESAARLAPSLRWQAIEQRAATSHMGMKGQEYSLEQCKLYLVDGELASRLAPSLRWPAAWLSSSVVASRKKRKNRHEILLAVPPIPYWQR